jgi:hypothetical protein
MISVFHLSCSVIIFGILYARAFTIEPKLLSISYTGGANKYRYRAIQNDDTNDGWDTTELDSLRAQRIERQQKSQSDSGKQQERDLFIPIVSLVSIAGLLGTYTYEMIRLYVRGELYLPWDS